MPKEKETSSETLFPDKLWEIHPRVEGEFPTDEDLEEIRDYVKARKDYLPIFNEELGNEAFDQTNDKKRKMTKCLMTTACRHRKKPKALLKLFERLKYLGKLHNRSWEMFNTVCLLSEAGCLEQAEHTDGHPSTEKDFPIETCDMGSCLFALEEGTTLVIEGQTVDLPVGSTLVFAGRLKHNGSPYSFNNYRIHGYYARQRAHLIDNSVGKLALRCKNDCGARFLSRGQKHYHEKCLCELVPLETRKANKAKGAREKAENRARKRSEETEQQGVQESGKRRASEGGQEK